MKQLLTATLFSAILLGSATADDKPVVKIEPRVVDLAICLDTSNSMDGLINSCRQKIWAIVNDLAMAKPTPKLRVALLSYGNNGYDKTAGWVRLDTGFTDDLDKVSQMLFGLKTNGGNELVGRVMQGALARLDWSKDRNALRIMVVAGNESADQDKEVSFRLMCKNAIGRDIMVNAIYCRRAENVESEWKEIARLSDGHFAAIDQGATLVIETPFDKEISALSTALNKTYVPFGKKGSEGARNQVVQDKNAEGLNRDAAALRSFGKSSKLYYCRWCLVDSTRNSKLKIEDVKVEDLPKNMRKMTMGERKAYLGKKQAERAEIQKKMATIQVKRAKFISAEMVKRNLDESKAFEAAVRKAIRAQAKSKGFNW